MPLLHKRKVVCTIFFLSSFQFHHLFFVFLLAVAYENPMKPVFGDYSLPRPHFCCEHICLPLVCRLVPQNENVICAQTLCLNQLQLVHQYEFQCAPKLKCALEMFAVLQDETFILRKFYVF